MEKRKNLTEAEFRFSIHYLNNGGNATQAAVSSGWSVNSARSQAYKIYQRPIVKEFIEYKRERARREMEITFDTQAADLKRVADLCAPKEAITHKECNVPGFTSIMSEINKMFGFHAAEKREMKVEIDPHTEELKELVEENKKEF